MALFPLLSFAFKESSNGFYSQRHCLERFVSWVFLLNFITGSYQVSV